MPSLVKIVPFLLFFVLSITLLFNIIFIINIPIGKVFRSGSVASLKETGVNFIQLETISSKEMVQLKVDDAVVYQDGGPDDHARGIHTLVLNEYTGELMAQMVFDTCGYEDEEDSMVLFLSAISDGRIIVLMVKDDATYNMKDSAKTFLQGLGSRFISLLGFRQSWTLILKKGGAWYNEAFMVPATQLDWSEPLLLRTMVDLAVGPQSTLCPGRDPVSTRRRLFCQRYEGYGSLCDCDVPVNLDVYGGSLPGRQLFPFPVAIIAGNRPRYLYRCLNSLLRVQGVNLSSVVVYVDGFYPEVVAVTDLYGVQSVQRTPICQKNCRITQHYRRSLEDAFNQFPEAPYILVIEEDLDLAVDILDYFEQTHTLLDRDPSLYCISAWNDQGYEHTVGDPGLMYRVETMPGLGWMLKRSLFLEELVPRWPGPDKFWDWDMWIRSDVIRRGRECIIPDVSRVYHFGVRGVNMFRYFHDRYFTRHALSQASGITFDTTLLIGSEYDHQLNQTIRSASIWNSTLSLCNYSQYLGTELGPPVVVFYISMEHSTDWETWLSLASCLRIWDLDVRGVHKSVWQLWLAGHRVIVVGSPASPFAWAKPPEVIPYRAPSGSKTHNS